MCRIYGLDTTVKYTSSSAFVDVETDIFSCAAVICQGEIMQKRYRKRRQRRIGIALLIASAIVVIALVIARRPVDRGNGSGADAVRRHRRNAVHGAACRRGRNATRRDGDARRRSRHADARAHAEAVG